MKQVIRTLIVDDERYAREELKHLLKMSPLIEVVGEAKTGESAILEAVKRQVDVVFLDIDMPKMNGMEVAKALFDLKQPPFIVFATAYSQFAAEAFRLDAVDYLLKPYDKGQLKQTIHRIENKLTPAPRSEEAKSHGKLAIQSDDDIHYILPKEILYIYREESMTKIVTLKDDFQVRMTLKELEARLSSFSFFRIHKSYLVNLNYISRLSPWFNGAYQLELEGREEKLSVSRNYVKALRQQLEL